jgi:hypothetical protein
VLNVNVAHRIASGWENTFSRYWKFWFVMTVLVALCLWATGLVLSWIWPARDAESIAADE